MSTARSQDNLVAYIAAAVVVSLVGIFVFTWSQARMMNQARPQIAFAQFGPYQIEAQNLSINASLAVQTSMENADWASNNRQALNAVFKKILADTDVETLKAPNGLELLQKALAKGCDTISSPHDVQAVLLTDFVFQAQDS